MDAAVGMDNPNFRGLLVRRTNDELRELKDKSQEMFSKIFTDAVWSEKNSQWTRSNGAKLWMSYLERDNDVMRYQGQSFTWIGFDELTQWPTPFAWNYLASRLRTHTGQIGLYQRASTNPGGPGMVWVKKMFVSPAKWGEAFWATDIETDEVLAYPPGHSKEGEPLFKRRFIPSKLQDNPYLYNSGDYEAMLLSLGEVERKQLLYGDWDITQGAAFSEWNRKIHVIEPFDIPSDWTRFRACDYGYGSRSGVLWFAVCPYNDQLVVYRELYTKKVIAKDLANMILDEEYGEKIYYGVLDSSLWHQRGDTGPSLAETMIAEGCRWRPADRSKGSRVAGKNQLHRRLQVDDEGEPGIVFFDNCVNTIAQIPVLPLDKNNPEDVDSKSEDHLYDALRYGIMSRPRSIAWEDNLAKRTWRPIDVTFGY